MTSENTSAEESSETEAIKKRLEELEKKVGQNEQGIKQNLPSFLKTGLAISVLLNIAAILSLFHGLDGFKWSVIFENGIAAYKAAFHVPIDWLFSWVGLTVPWWVKDVFVVLGSGLLAINFTLLKLEGKSVWAILAKPITESFSLIEVIVGVIFTIFLFLLLFFFGPFNFFVQMIRDRGKDERTVRLCLFYFKIWASIILLAIVLLGVNFAFLKIGL